MAEVFLRMSADVLGAALALKCLLCPLRSQSSRALNSPLQLIYSLKRLLHGSPAWVHVAQVVWVLQLQTTALMSPFPPHLQSFPSVCGCVEAAWRFFPAAASDMFLGSGTRMNSQKAMRSHTLSESAVSFLHLYHPHFFIKIKHRLKLDATPGKG